MNIQQDLSAYRERVHRALESHLPDTGTLPKHLHEAMRYSVLNGGKRIRAMLVYAACQSLQGELSQADGAACAVELIHAYSLIHDDLPAMDDDDLRRGKPTCHKVFGDAMAILAGDALQTLAFAQLSDGQAENPRNQLRMIAELARASGSQGMVGGQCIDLEATAHRLTPAKLEEMHRHKTGALIEASVVLGALASGNCQDYQLNGLRQFAADIGLAFQIKDDLLDVESSTESLGKIAGADEANAKATYPALLGLKTARQKAENHYQRAISAMHQLDLKTSRLVSIAELVINRTY